MADRVDSEAPHHDDGGGHGHGHGHGHDHAGSEPSQNAKSPLPAFAGADRVLFFDAPSGIAGDMTIAALLDLGVPLEVVKQAIEGVQLEGVSLEVETGVAGAIGATRFRAHETQAQPSRDYAEISRLLARSSLQEPVQVLAQRIFRRLAEAEAEVHRIAVDDVQFHEVGAADAIVDIVGAAACLCHLDARVMASPLPMGHGSVMCQHGRLPLPAPATVQCLRGVPTYDAGIDGELVTPTGAAILATVAEEYLRWPAIVPERVGWGAGTRHWPDRPNVLRVVLGKPHALESSSETHVVVEANVDDMTGELAGHALQTLFEVGALDAWGTPILMKKGRPGLIISALAKTGDAGRIADALLRETSSIGVRFSSVSRRELARSVVEVETLFGTIPVKVSGASAADRKMKPEFDACAEAARKHGVPVRVVIEAALARASLSPGARG